MKYLVLLYLVIFSVSSHASSAAVDVENFQLWSTTRGMNIIRVIPQPVALANPGNCSNTDSYMVKSSLSDAEKSRVYSTLLSAKLAGITVSV